MESARFNPLVLRVDMTKKKITISVANDENDDWLKKLDDGRWQKQDLQAHEDAKKLTDVSQD